MKTRISILLFSLLFLFSCTLRTFEGPPKTETRSLSEYDEVKVSGPFDVTVDPRLAYDLEITAPEDALEYVKTEVKGDVLVIDLDVNGFMSPGMTVRISNDYINKVTVNGSGEFEGSIKPKEDLVLGVYGSGDIDVQANAATVKTEVSGSGEIDVRGECNIALADISGSGDINLAELKAKDADVKISGSGEIDVYASGILKASISGSGDIDVHGNPSKLDKSVSGSGSIRSY